MTIESVLPADYGTWRCTVGVQEWEGTVIKQRTPMQALISVPTGKGKAKFCLSEGPVKCREK